MTSFSTELLRLYLPLVGWVLVGWLLGHWLPRQIALLLGQGLFWIGVPISILAFLRGANLSGAIWIAPLVAWIAILLGAGLAWLWIRGQPWSRPSQGSFLLSTMVGNTGYLGYPIVLTLVGPQYFAWALFYDMLGTTLGAYGLGVLLAARMGGKLYRPQQLVLAIAQNPALWSFGFGFAFRAVPLPEPVESTLRALAWTVITLSLVLIGLRLSQLSSWQHLPRASVSLGIKMLIVPLVIGFGLSQFPLDDLGQLVVILQVAMPPAFATLVISEAYDLDRELAVTTLVLGSTGLLVMLPIWLWLFGP